MGERVFRAMFPAEFTNCLSKEFPELKGTFTHAIEIFQKLQEFLGGHQAKIHVTGHSLGAWVAIELAKKFKDRISGGHVFNAGSNPLRKLAGEFWQALWASFSDDILLGEFYHHHIFGDIVSSHYKKLGSRQTINYTDPSWMFYEKHGIKNFAEQYDNNWEFPLIWFSGSTRFSDM